MKPEITLIFPESPFLINQAVFPPLGILYLSAYLKRLGFNVQCLDLGIGHKKEDAESDVIGISFTSPQKNRAYELLDYYKGLGKTVICGGAHPTHMPNECRDRGFDYTILGEGEEWLANWLYEYYNIYFTEITKSIGINFYPYPDRKALPIKDYCYEIDGRKATVLMTSRGCPYNCSFCAKVSKKFRAQSAERTLDEIYYLNNEFGYDAFMIFDDVFVYDIQRLSKIASGLQYKDFKFRCFARSNLISEDTCHYLNKMNVVEVGIGVESGSDNILKLNMKGTTKEINEKAINLLKKHGIRVKTFIIVGLPGETNETVRETMQFLYVTKPDDVDVSIFKSMPGSRIFKNPDRFGVRDTYGTDSLWYKGKPNEYRTDNSTDELSCSDLIYYRDIIEKNFKSQELLK